VVEANFGGKMTLEETGHVCSLIMTYTSMKNLYDNFPVEDKTASLLSNVYDACIKDLEKLLSIESEL
jgi:hypothetical protein